jgi:hypothetical protein
MATIKKISNCGQTIPLVCAVLRYVLENLHMPHVFHTTALAKVTLNRTHTTGWAPAKFGISPISRKPDEARLVEALKQLAGRAVIHVTCRWVSPCRTRSFHRLRVAGRIPVLEINTTKLYSSAP